MAGPRNTADGLAAALIVKGWKVSAGNFPGAYRADRPDSEEEIPTPDYILNPTYGDSPYPFPTYTRIDQITFLVSPDGGVRKLWHRTGVPWVETRETPISYRKAMDLIEKGESA